MLCKVRAEFSLSRWLMLITQTSSAYAEPFRFAINHKRSCLNIGEPASPCMLLRMAYIVAEADSLPT